MYQILLVALGGAIGSVARYLTGILSSRLFGPNFPWGTLAVNILGSFAIGLLIELIARRLNASADMRLFLVTGLMGGFTTFSSFSLDFASLFERGDLGLAASYLIGSVVISLLAVFAGLAFGRALL
jgi:CrcB protein